MTSVYTVAFLGDEFLMVFNPKRKGWEMPGGKIGDDESAIDAAVREYMEETGHGIHVISTKEMNGCHVCAAVLGKMERNGEFAFRLFSELPDALSFGRSEYDGVTEWARSVVKDVVNNDVAR